MYALEQFEKHQAEIEPGIVSFLERAGEGAIEAYGSVVLRHNTLERFAGAVLINGLTPANNAAIPDEQDVEFAYELFRREPDFLSAQNRFNRYIIGMPDGRDPGVFFYAYRQGNDRTRDEYGVPERMFILASEMGAVMAQDRFSPAEREQARAIYNKYREVLTDEINPGIAVFEADPFSPVIINHRLEYISQSDLLKNTERLDLTLRHLDTNTFEGVYIPGSVPAEDLTKVDHYPSSSGYQLREEADINPSQSRFYAPRSY